MKSARPTKTPVSDDVASPKAKVAELVLTTFRKNREKMTKLTEADLKSILDRSLGYIDEPFQELEFDPKDLEYDPDSAEHPVPTKAVETSVTSTPSKVSSSGSEPITIRIPKDVVAAYKAKAKELGVPYQTLMNRELRKVSAGFKSSSAPV